MKALKVRLSILSSLMALAAVTFVCFAETALAQQRIRITEGQVAPTPIAIAEFTDLGGEISDAGREIAEIISNNLLSSGLFDPIDSAPSSHRQSHLRYVPILPIGAAWRERAVGWLCRD